MDVKVIREYYDKVLGNVMEVGTVIREVTEDRARMLIRRRLVEEVEPEPAEKPKEIPEEEKQNKKMKNLKFR